MVHCWFALVASACVEHLRSTDRCAGPHVQGMLSDAVCAVFCVCQNRLPLLGGTNSYSCKSKNTQGALFSEEPTVCSK